MISAPKKQWTILIWIAGFSGRFLTGTCQVLEDPKGMRRKLTSYSRNSSSVLTPFLDFFSHFSILKMSTIIIGWPDLSLYWGNSLSGLL
jgi:hypothetical protein